MCEVKHLYGWFSPTQAKISGTYLYLNLEDKEVLVSEVTNNPNPSFERSVFKDREYKGEVLTCVKSFSKFLPNRP